MNLDFPRVIVMSIVIVFTYSFLASAEAAETVPLPDLPALIPPENNSDSSGSNSRYQSSVAVLREEARNYCRNAMDSAKDAMDAYEELEAYKRKRDAGRPATVDEFGRDEGEVIRAFYEDAYNWYMDYKKKCELATRDLNNRLATEYDHEDSDELFDPTDPLTAQWAGTWNVRSKHDYGPAKGGSYPSEFTVEITWHGCEVSWSDEPRYDCRVSGRTLTFWGYHKNDNINRIDWTFFHSGLTLEGEFSGKIRGTPAGGTYTGKKAGY